MSKYDAFISYCHGGRDSRIAETLHKKLEHYHVPREVRMRTGKNKIKRVFLDNEELPVSNMLTKEICDALDQTEYLIVICSYRSKESEWVNKEVAYFLEHHDDSKVLPVVIEGQMKDVVPEKILIDKDGNTTDHMYADLSRTSWMDTRKMMRTAKLRILAHLLGVEYPELKRRDLEYRRQQIAAVAGIVLAVGCMFGVYAAFQRHQIAVARREKLEQQADLVADQAWNLLQAGDRNGALEEVLSIREDGASGKLVSPMQIYVLNEALNSYTTGEWLEFAPSGIVGQNLKESFFSSDGKYLFALDEDASIFCYSTEEEQELWKLSQEDLGEEIEKERYRLPESASAEITKILPYDENKLVVVQKYAVSVVSGETGMVEKIFPVSSGSFYLSSRNFIRVKGNFLVGEAGSRICFFDLTTGRETARLDFPDILETQYFGEGTKLGEFSSEIDYLDINDSGTQAVFWFEDYLDEKVDTGVFLYDLTEDKLQCLSHERTSLLEFIDETHVVAMHVKSVSGGIPSYQVVVYDTESGQETVTSDLILSEKESHSRGILIKEFQGTEKSFRGLVFYLNDRLYILDLDQGVIVEEYVFDSDIIQLVDWEKNSCLVGTQSGWVKRIRFTMGFTDMTFVALPEESCSCVNASNRNGFIAVQVNGQDIFYKIPADPKLACFEPEDGKDADIQLIDYYHFDDASFMLVEGQDLANDRYFLTLIDMETGEKVHQVALEAGYLLSYMDVYAEEGSIWLSYVEYYNSDQNSQNFHRINVDTGEEYVNTFASRENYDSPIISSKYRKIICEKEFKVLEMLSWDGNTIAEEKMLNLDSYAYQYALSGDQRYLFLIYEKDDAMVSYVYDLEEDVFLEVEGISQKKDSRYNILIQPADQGPKICVYTDKSLYVVDCSEQKVLSEIGLGKRVSSSELEFSFFDHGQYILISEPEKVQLYDADSGEYRSSVSYSPKKTSKLVGGGSIWTNRSSRWFTVENSKSNYDSSAGTLLDERMLFYVDDELNMHPHVGVVDGFADFEGERIMIPVDNKIYWAGFYDEETLIREAEEILGVDRAGEGAAEGSGLGAEGAAEVAGPGVDEDAAISQSTDNAAGAGIGQDTKKNTSGSFGKNAADSAVTAEKKAFTDASERTIWEVKENLTSIEAVDQGENYVISLTGKQAKKVENISANIFWESVEDGRTVYYKALSGRKLEVNDKNQIVFPKNQEIPGLWNGTHSQLIPVLRLDEKLDNGVRSWSTGSFFVNDIHDLSYVSNLPKNLHVSEGAGGKLDYIINSDSESLVVREEETAYVRQGQFVLSNTVGSFAESIRDEKGTVLPAEKWGRDVIGAITASVDFAEQPELSLEELAAFENAFSAQICIYYSDGTIQTTDILPMKEETSQYCEIYVLEEGDGQWTFDIYPEHAELRRYIGDGGKTVIPSEVKGVPVTTIRTGAFLQRYSDGDDVKEWTIIIPESVETIDPTGFYFDQKMQIELASEKHFMIRDGLMMTADGKRVISGLECGQSELEIPDGVETIDPYAFNQYSKLEKVHFPEGLKAISSYAFYQKSLKEITLPDSLEFIGVHAFGRDVYAWNLKDQNVQECKSVRIGKNVRFIGENAFSGICVREFSVDPQNELYCAMDGVIYTKDKKILVQYPNGKNGVYTVPDGVEVIPQSALAFSGVYRDVVPDSWGITEFRMSDSVKTVKYGNVPYSRRFAKVVLSKNLEDSDSFLGMDLFEVLELSEDSPVVVDEDGNYYNRDKTRLYLCGEKVEEYVFPESVTTFDYGAFDHCPMLRKITIPSGLDLDTDSAQSFVTILKNRADLMIEEIEVGEGNPDFRVVDGKLMSASGKTMLFEDFRENTNHAELRWE